MEKQFKIIQESEEEVDDHGNWGYLLLAPDGELWKVGRPRDDDWGLEAVIEVPLKVIGADEMIPDWAALDCKICQQMRAENASKSVATYWGVEVAQQHFPDYRPKDIVVNGSSSSGMLFSPSQFDDSGIVTAEKKATFANTLAFLICHEQTCFDTRFFTPTFFRQLVKTFGFDPNMEKKAFKDRYLSDASGKLAFVTQLANHVPVGVCADVEKMVGAWVRLKWVPYWTKAAARVAARNAKS